MSDKPNDAEPKNGEVQQKSIDGDSSNQVAEAGSSSVEALPRIFKLDLGCFGELFEWLSFKDLLVLRQTSKQFKRKADYYINEYYPGVKLGYGKVIVSHDNIEQFRYLDSDCIKSIKAMQFHTTNLTSSEIDGIKEILNHVELLEMPNWDARETDFYGNFLKFCPKIKCLTITDVDMDGETFMGTGNLWLQQEYPTLERFAIRDDNDGYYDGVEIAQLETFLKINPNIQNLCVSLHFLWENRNWLRNTDIKIDQLDIESVYIENMEDIFELLMDLHAHGFYKRLHFHAMVVYDDYMSLINSVPGLEKLHLVESNVDETNLVVPPSLRELNFGSGGDIKDPETLVNNLANVERIYVRSANFTDILPLIRSSARLKEIRVKDLHDGTYFKDGIIDLVTLNKERHELANAQKLKLYVNEEIVLKMKWNGIETKHPLIELKRTEECERKPYSAFDSLIYPEY